MKKADRKSHKTTAVCGCICGNGYHMGITSFYFLCFFAVILILYYVIPKRFQWGLLLGCSVAYYLTCGSAVLIFYPLAAVSACYAGTRLLGSVPVEESGKRKKILAATVLVNIGILVVLKYVNFGIYTIDGIATLFGSSEELIKSVDFLVPLGVSFYTFSLLGYVVDVYYGLAKPQNNYLKLLLYGMYFPAIISGPILQYREHGEQFFAPHTFDYRRVTGGLQRMMWGFLKAGDRGAAWHAGGYGVWRVCGLSGRIYLGGNGMLCIPALHRFLGLYGHCHWYVGESGNCASGEFQYAVFLGEHCGVLAQMAYYAGRMDEGICVLSGAAHEILYEFEPVMA